MAGFAGICKTPPLEGEVSIATLADATTSFLRARDLMGMDVALGPAVTAGNEEISWSADALV